MKILVVDDDEYNRQLLQWMLEEQGHEAICAEDGASAIAAFRGERPKLVLMDVMMPGMDGYAACQSIKEIAGSQHVPVIFLTALSDDDSLVRCIEAGGDDFLNKPLNMVMLQAKIRAHVRILQLNDELAASNRELQSYRSHIESEHAITDRVMANAMSRNELNIPGLRTYLSPQSNFSGDLVLVNSSQAGTVYALIGDFTGHGLPAAVGSIPVSQAFYTMTRKNLSITQIAREMNSLLGRFLPEYMFMAACLMEISPDRSKVRIWCGGLPDAYLLRPGLGILRTISARHMPLGIQDDAEFDEALEVVEMLPGDRLVVATDGVIETEGADGDFFGEERMQQALTSQEDSLVALVEAVEAFRLQQGQSDDVSILEVECRSEFAYVADASGDHSAPAAAHAFEMHCQFQPRDLRLADPAAHILQLLRNYPMIREQYDLIATVLSELFSNALDHGLLRLDSKIKMAPGGFEQYYEGRQRGIEQLQEGWIRVSIKFVPEPSPALLLRVQDSGPGFDPASLDEVSEDAPYGRGIKLLQSLCEKLEFQDNGSSVRALFRLKNGAQI